MRRRSGIALIAAVLLADAPAGRADRRDVAGYQGSFRWGMADADFGGLSGLEVGADGAQFLALTDRGAVIEGRFARDEAGLITGVAEANLHRLSIPAGAVPEEFRMDSEGLAADGTGGFYVTTEYVTRIMHYADADALPTQLPSPREFVGLDQNGGLEALAINSDGALYTLPEVSRRSDGTAPLYRFRNGTWGRPALIPVDGEFLPVGADFDPDGRLYLLERKFFGLGGFATRVRRLSLSDGGVISDETLLESPAGTFSNLEGIAVWQDASGATRIILISDDNFLAVLGTEVVEFLVAG
jgi:hypothetical protein